MAFKIDEQDGNWILTQDGRDTRAIGGTPISYADFKELKDAPRKAGERFHRDKQGVLRKRSTSKTIKP